MAALRRRELVSLDTPTNDYGFALLDQQGGASLEPPSNPAADYNTEGHYVSPCEFRISNDPLVVSDHDVCDATIYGCARSHTFLITHDEDVKEVDLKYDYDFYYQLDSSQHNFNDLVEFLEGTMLEHLATTLGIKHCPPETSSDSAVTVTRGSGTRQRRLNENQKKGRNLVEFTDEQKSVFIAINSSPADVPTDEYGRYSENYECVTPPPEDSSIKCQSMVGLMKIYLEEARVTEEDALAISDSILMVFEEGMENNVYTKGAIRDLVYIHDRTKHPSSAAPLTETETQPVVVVAPPDDMVAPPDDMVISPVSPSETEDVPAAAAAAALPSNVDGDGTNESGLGDAMIGIIACVCALVFLCLVLVLFLLARRQQVRASTTASDNGSPKSKSTDNSSTKSSPNRSPKRRGNHRRSPHAIVRDQSLEGAEIPGSLAAMDALALRPQKDGDEAADAQSFSVEDCGAVPPTPPRVSRTTAQNNDTISDPPFSRTLEKSPLAADDEGTESSPPVQSSMSPVPLSPVKNRRSGVSPSKVSPKRLPNNLNEPVVLSTTGQSDEKYCPISTQGRRDTSSSPTARQHSPSRKSRLASVEVQSNQPGVGTKGSVRKSRR